MRIRREVLKVEYKGLAHKIDSTRCQKILFESLDFRRVFFLGTPP